MGFVELTEVILLGPNIAQHPFLSLHEQKTRKEEGGLGRSLETWVTGPSPLLSLELALPFRSGHVPSELELREVQN